LDGVEQGMVGWVLQGRYRLTAHLTAGRFGDFWVAEDEQLRTPCAVKLLKPELFQDEKALARFERETRLLASFRHPNLLQVVDHGQTEAGMPWLVTELTRGRNLGDAIGELALTVDEVRSIGAQIASVLAAAHAHGVVHRGLDPEAVLLVDDGTVRVHDFGLARRTGPTGDPVLTAIGERLGRCEYMAPEYIEETLLDARTDLYVLGVILFEMLAGQPPFVGRPSTVMEKHVEEDPWVPSEISEHDVPPWLDSLILALLAKDPGDRPASGHQVAEALQTGRWPL